MRREHLKCTDLSARDQREMLDLLSSHFQAVSLAQFEADLATKNWVVLIRQPDGLLAGFSTLLVRDLEIDGSPLTMVCSGDTIVSPSAWSTMALPRAWLEALRAICPGDDRKPLYWLLITSGFRTYRFMPTFWNEFYPRFDAPTPPREQRLLDALATSSYGHAYNPATGIVYLPHPQPLRSNLAHVPPERLEDPHVRFFLQRNPGHARGDELACLADLRVENLSPAGRRIDPVARALRT